MEQRITDKQAKAFVSCEPEKCGYCENKALCCATGISASIRKVSADLLDARAQRDELLAALTHAATDYIDQNGSVPSWWTDKIRQMVKETTHA